MIPEVIIICLVAFIASGITLISGFGLGTILLPVFAIFFPLDIAVGLTAIVHFLNNIFKLFLLGKYAHKETLIRFGIPSIIASFIGAYLLLKLSSTDAIGSYLFFDKTFYIRPVNVIISILLFFFSLMEIVPALKNLQFDKKHFIAGGFLSGFFGGLSGHQGALRTAFLIKAGLSREQFLATGITLACFIDITRITVYSGHIKEAMMQEKGLLIAAVLSAFAGVFIVSKLLKKITISFIQKIIGIFLMIFSILIGMGII